MSKTDDTREALIGALVPRQAGKTNILAALAAHEQAIRAEAWDEGVSAFESAHGWDNFEPWQHLVSNPYKEATR